MKPIKGSIVAMVTPFKEDESVDFERLEQTIEYQIKNGTDGILVLGTTGESTTMTHEEDDEVARLPLRRSMEEFRSSWEPVPTAHRHS